MMLVPLSTDAPIYHFPWATIGLIVVNVLFLVATLGFLPTVESYEQFRFLTLEFDTINPFQWLTTNFMHDGVLHLVGNMFFLWGFGLVVEGKLGWKRFLPLYLGMGIVYGAFIQIMMFVLFDSEGVALGASAAIFGLLGIAVIWAPKNDLNCFLWMGVFSRMVQMPIIVFGSIYIVLQFLFLALRGFHMGSELLHLAGLAVGLPVGLYCLKKDIVDCEGWDYFTVYYADAEERKFRQTQRRRERSAARTKEVRDELDGRLSQLNSSLEAALNGGNDQVACAMYEKFVNDFHHGRKCTDAVSLKLISALQRQKKWDASIPVMVQLLEKHAPEKTVAIRLNLAKTLIARTDQPRQGAAVLSKIPQTGLQAKHQELVAKLHTLAKQKKGDSVEIDIQDW